MCQEEIGKGANTVFIAVYVLNAVNSNRLEQSLLSILMFSPLPTGLTWPVYWTQDKG